MELVMELWAKGYITDSLCTINQSRLFDLYADYPELNTSGIAGTKVKDRNARQVREVRIRAARYAELKRLWEELNRRYVIFFEKEVNRLVVDALPGILAGGVFSAQVINSRRERLDVSEGTASVLETAGVQ